MSATHLIPRREVYLEGPDATELNTVDVWTSESDQASEADERVWVVFVFPHYPTAHRRHILNNQQICSRGSLARS
jgi:hypothetical protein